MVGRRENAFQEVLLTRRASLGSHTSAALGPVFGQTRALDVSRVADGHHHLFVGNHVLNAQVGAAVFDGGATLVSKALLDVESIRS